MKENLKAGHYFFFTFWAYCYLFIFFLMAAVNIVLVCVMRKSPARSGYYWKKETCRLVTLLIFFELSYLSRFLWDMVIINDLEEDSFPYIIGFDVTLYIDVLPFIGLLLIHHNNFKRSKNLGDADAPIKREKSTSMNESQNIVYDLEEINITASSMKSTEKVLLS